MEINANLLASQPLPQIQYATESFNPFAEYSSEFDRNYCIPGETELLFLSQRRENKKISTRDGILTMREHGRQRGRRWVVALWIFEFVLCYIHRNR